MGQEEVLRLANDGHSRPSGQDSGNANSSQPSKKANDPNRNPTIEEVQDEDCVPAARPASAHASTTDVKAESSPNEVEKTEEELIAEAAARLLITHEDVVITVMGLTGTGKSTFIELLSKVGVQIGHGLASCTSSIGVYPFRHHSGRTIYLVDTLGFDDSYRTDTQVLKEVALFLGALYTKNIKLAGIIYFHRITDNKMGHHALKNLVMFQKLCGKPTLANVALVTTMWDSIISTKDMHAAERREVELIEKPEYWGDMLEEGSQIFRHDDGLSSAHRIIDHIMNLQNDGVTPVIAPQLIDDHMTLRETTAGQEVERELLKAEKRHAEELQVVREGLQAAIDSGNKKHQEKFKRMEAEALKKAAEHKADLADLKKDHARIQKENETKHNKEMSELKAKIKAFDDAAPAREKELKDLQTTINTQTTTLQNLQTQITNKDDAHTKALQKQADTAKLQLDALQTKFDNTIRANADRRGKTKEMLAAVGTTIGGIVVTVASAVTLNPAGAVAGMAMVGAGSSEAAMAGSRM